MQEGVSVVIPTLNEEKTLGEVLDILEAQKYRPLEIVIVDAGSNDRTIEIAKQFDVKLIERDSREGHVEDTRKGFEEAKHDLVCSLHADCVPKNSQWLSKMVRCMANNTGAVRCPDLTDQDAWDELTMIQKAMDATARLEETEIEEECTECRFFAFRAVMFRKKALKEVGGVDSERYYRAGEDADLCHKFAKSDWKVKSAPTYVIHRYGSHQDSVKDYLMKTVRECEARGVNRRRYPELMKWGVWNEATKTLLYFGLLVPVVQYLSAALVVSKFGYQTYDAATNDIGVKAASLMPVFLISDVLAITGFWKGYITGKQSI
ncbi:glycosyltransferase [Candidatus Nanohalococcus occultus]|uniref:glycosyltransferase n=1 Tax=Candidatus Nanohalococcus occultus TaxID=2978047 RepID=UPI0039E11702